MPDWAEWHGGYDADVRLRERLASVQARVIEAADGSRRGGFRVISICGGQGHDLAGALAGHPAAERMSGCLVELDPRNAASASERLAAAGLSGITVICDDAAELRHYRTAVPADLVLLCGLFGNIADADIENTISRLPMLCAPGATVIWTRHRRAPDLTPTIRLWFAEHGFEELAFETPGELHSVGTNRFTAATQPFQQDVRLFDFIGYDVLQQTRE
jgi:hypothetical protein